MSKQPRDPEPRGLRILIVNGGYLTATPSGGDRHLLALAGGLAAHQAVARVIYVAPEAVRPWLAPGVDARLYRSAPSRTTLGAVARYLARLLQVAARLREVGAVDVVLVSPGLVDLLPAAWTRLRGARVGVFAYHLGDVRAAGAVRRPLQAVLSRLADLPARWLLRRANHVFTAVREVVDQLVASGVERRRIVIQRPIVEVEAIRAAPAFAAPELEAPDVLFVGRLVARKGVFDLLTAAHGLDATVGLVGEGEEAPALERRIADEGLTHVRLLGGLSDPEVFGLMRAARVLVLPSYEEGYGLVLAEALVAGTPAIAYALPHYDEVFGDAVEQVARGDVDALRRALARRLAESPVENVPAIDVTTRRTAAAQIVGLVGEVS